MCIACNIGNYDIINFMNEQTYVKWNRQYIYSGLQKYSSPFLQLQKIITNNFPISEHLLGCDFDFDIGELFFFFLLNVAPG